jgi:hypothetical protein
MAATLNADSEHWQAILAGSQHLRKHAKKSAKAEKTLTIQGRISYTFPPTDAQEIAP